MIRIIRKIRRIFSYPQMFIIALLIYISYTLLVAIGDIPTAILIFSLLWPCVLMLMYMNNSLYGPSYLELYKYRFKYEIVSFNANDKQYYIPVVITISKWGRMYEHIISNDGDYASRKLKTIKKYINKDTDYISRWLNVYDKEEIAYHKIALFQKAVEANKEKHNKKVNQASNFKNKSIKFKA